MHHALSSSLKKETIFMSFLTGGSKHLSYVSLLLNKAIYLARYIHLCANCLSS